MFDNNNNTETHEIIELDEALGAMLSGIILSGIVNALACSTCPNRLDGRDSNFWAGIAYIGSNMVGSAILALPDLFENNILIESTIVLAITSIVYIPFLIWNNFFNKNKTDIIYPHLPPASRRQMV